MSDWTDVCRICKNDIDVGDDGAILLVEEDNDNRTTVNVWCSWQCFAKDNAKKIAEHAYIGDSKDLESD